MSNLYSNSIFFVEVNKIYPNPYQPRREFEESKLRDLADSIRMYGVLQPLVVSRVEKFKEDGGILVEYELIAGERRLRASKLAGLVQVPVIIRTGDDSQMKLELAIIENLQREDLNAVERARAFLRFVDEFKYTHAQIGQKMGKSREYVSNTLRLLQLPEEILNALSEGKISEGHTRPLMMLSDRPDEQIVLFKEILLKRISVREAERIARRVARDKVRKKELMPDPELLSIEQVLQEALGTRVHVERREVGGKIEIDFFSNDDLITLVDAIRSKKVDTQQTLLTESKSTISTTQQSEDSVSANDVASFPQVQSLELVDSTSLSSTSNTTETTFRELEPVLEVHKAIDWLGIAPQALEIEAPEPEYVEMLDDRTKEEIEKEQNNEDDEDLYRLKNFSI